MSVRVTEGLLKKIIELTLTDDDNDVRAASLNLASTLLQDDDVMGEIPCQ